MPDTDSGGGTYGTYDLGGGRRGAISGATGQGTSRNYAAGAHIYMRPNIAIDPELGDLEEDLRCIKICIRGICDTPSFKLG
jgi:hypothetical protein